MGRRTWLWALAFTLLFTGTAHAGPVTREIPFSRKVRLTVPATYTFRFSLWDEGDPGTGSMAWSEEADLKLTTRKLSHKLGSVTPLDGVNFSEQLWVQVERWKPKASEWAVVGGRTMLTVVPYALWSASLGEGAVTSVEILDGAVGPADLEDGTALAEILDDDGDASGLDADLLDGRQAGNASGGVPVSNGTVNTDLNADMVDGSHASNLARMGRYSIPGVTGGSVTIPIPHYNSFQIVIGEAFGSPDKVAWVAGVENDYDMTWIGIKPDGTVVTGTANLTSTDTVMEVSPNITLKCPGAARYELVLTSTNEDVRAFITW